MMKAYGVKSTQIKAQESSKPKEIEKHLNMEETTEFQIKGVSYIKIKFNDGSIGVLENRETLELNKIFDIIQREYNINLRDGKLNAEKIFEILENYKINIKLNNLNDIKPEVLSDNAKTELAEVKKVFHNDEIIAAPENGIFINKSKNGMLVEVVKNDNGYEVKQVREKIYHTKEVATEVGAGNYDTLSISDLNEEIDAVSTFIERPEDVPYEMSVIDGNLDEEKALDYLKENKLERARIVSILAKLRSKKLAKGKQLVKVKPNAYVDLFVMPLIVIFLFSLALVFSIIKICI